MPTATSAKRDAEKFRVGSLLASMGSSDRSRSAIESGASSVGPFNSLGGKLPPYSAADVASGFVAGSANAAKTRAGSRWSAALQQRSPVMGVAARAGNRRSVSAAQCAGCGGEEGTLEPLTECEDLALHREAERDTTASLNRQPFIHTSNVALWQGKRHSAATQRGNRRRVRKPSLTVRFYCDMRCLGGCGI